MIAPQPPARTAPSATTASILHRPNCRLASPPCESAPPASIESPQYSQARVPVPSTPRAHALWRARNSVMPAISSPLMHHHAMKQPLRRRHRHQCRALPSATRLPKHQHTMCIAAKLRNILPIHFEGQHQIQLPRHARVRKALTTQFREIKKTKCIQPPVHRHHYDIAALRSVACRCTARYSPCHTL